MALLAVENLAVRHRTRAGMRTVLDGISFSLDSGRVLGLVGESGSGKSQTALAIMGLLPPSATVSGRVRFENHDLLTLSEAARQQRRGNRIGMVFQDPMSSLNPYLAVGTQMAEVLQQHRGMARAAARAEALRMLAAVQVSQPAQRLGQYPHELSGGMRQRVMIAMMLLARPALLIADEPTTALDVTVQARILRLLADLRREMGLALLLISHDLGVMADVADEVLVLYGGRAMEHGAATAVLHDPAHPYTRGLLAARPTLTTPLHTPLRAIPGSPPTGAVPGCPFAPRCAEAQAVCTQQVPHWQRSPHGRGLACHAHPVATA